MYHFAREIHGITYRGEGGGACYVAPRLYLLSLGRMTNMKYMLYKLTTESVKSMGIQSEI